MAWLLRATAGGVAAGASRCLVAPLDVLKIRFQLQVAPVGVVGGVTAAASRMIGYKGAVTGSLGHYTSLAQAVQAIVAEEGVRAFWR
jgi:solute carrier family 25 thiamine pyrophosphate transporter 19